MLYQQQCVHWDLCKSDTPKKKKKKTVIRGRAWGDMWCNLASAKIPDLNTSFSTCSTL